MAETAQRIATETDPAEDLRTRMEDLIRGALGLKYTSYSSQNRIPTGNAYQSVRLHKSVTRGFRTLRSSVLAGLPIQDAKVLDLGCNLGELSRLARASGAALVDGFEYDPYFVQIGQAINALNGLSRVSFYQRDVTDPTIYKENYDLVFSFSVFAYTRKVLPQIHKICKRMLVMETHKVTPSWAKEYIDQVTPHFPHYCIVQRTDWGQALDGGARLLLVYAHDRDDIVNYISRRSLELGDNPEDLRHLDLKRSDPRSLKRFRRWLADHPHQTIGDLQAPMEKAISGLSDFSVAPDYGLAASSAVYWIAYFHGFFQFAKEGRVTGTNTYVRYLRQACRDLNIDPYMTKLVEGDEAGLFERVGLRFEDTKRVVAGDAVAPILIYNPMPAGANLDSSLVDHASGTQLQYSHQDGYHRHCSSLVAGADRLPYRMIWQPQAGPFAAKLETSPELGEQLFGALATGLF